MLKEKGITDIFFDLDHTLWDFDKNSALAFHKVFETHRLDVDVKAFLTHYEPINLDYWKLYRDERVTKEALRRGRLNDTFAKLKLQHPTEVIDALAISYIDFLPLNNFLFPGTIEILDYLKPHYNLHIITNGFDEVQHKKLVNSKIDGYFKTITNSEMVGVKKPNPGIFLAAMETAATTPGRSVMVGDNQEADILGARAVGMQAIYFGAEALAEESILSIQALEEIKRYL